MKETVPSSLDLASVLSFEGRARTHAGGLV